MRLPLIAPQDLNAEQRPLYDDIRIAVSPMCQYSADDESARGNPYARGWDDYRTAAGGVNCQ